MTVRLPVFQYRTKNFERIERLTSIIKIGKSKFNYKLVMYLISVSPKSQKEVYLYKRGASEF